MSWEQFPLGVVDPTLAADTYIESNLLPRYHLRMRGITLMLCMIVGSSSAIADFRNSEVPVVSEPPTVTVILTFDDGPDSRKRGNRTASVLRFLSSKKYNGHGFIPSIFFVQTHAKRRGGNERGRELIKKAHTDGHVLAVHTGSDKDHIAHTKRVRGKAYDKDPSSDGLSALDTDLMRAKKRLEKLTGVVPTLVRPPYRKHNDKVVETYHRNKLSMLLWDVDSKDARVKNHNLSREVYNGMRFHLRRGQTVIVILLHDINPRSSRTKTMRRIIASIERAAKKQGMKLRFPSNRAEIITALAVREKQRVAMKEKKESDKRAARVDALGYIAYKTVVTALKNSPMQ